MKTFAFSLALVNLGFICCQVGVCLGDSGYPDTSKGIVLDPEFRWQIIEQIEEKPSLGDFFAAYDFMDQQFEYDGFRTRPSGQALHSYAIARRDAELCIRVQPYRPADRSDIRVGGRCEWFFQNDEFVGFVASGLYWSNAPVASAPMIIPPLTPVEGIDANISRSHPGMLVPRFRPDTVQWIGGVESILETEDSWQVDHDLESGHRPSDQRIFHTLRRARCSYLPGTLLESEFTWSIVILDEEFEEVADYIIQRRLVREWQDEMPKVVVFETYSLELIVTDDFEPSLISRAEMEKRTLSSRQTFSLRDLRRPVADDITSISQIENEVVAIMHGNDYDAQRLPRVTIDDATGSQTVNFAWNDQGGVWEALTP